MKKRVLMLRQVDQLDAGSSYLLDPSQADALVDSGAAMFPGDAENREMKPAGPSETKPYVPKKRKQA